MTTVLRVRKLRAKRHVIIMSEATVKMSRKISVMKKIKKRTFVVNKTKQMQPKEENDFDYDKGTGRYCDKNIYYSQLTQQSQTECTETEDSESTKKCNIIFTDKAFQSMFVDNSPELDDWDDLTDAINEFESITGTRLASTKWEKSTLYQMYKVQMQTTYYFLCKFWILESVIVKTKLI